MEAIERQRHTRRGRTFEVRLHYDPDPPSPTEWDASGRIYSLNHWHASYDPGEIERVLAAGEDHVRLSYYEHGDCLWTVAGELPAGADDIWDSVKFAGIWVPDACLIKEAKNYGGRARQLAMEKWARQFCANWTDYANGHVYGYSVVELVPCGHCGQVEKVTVDSCWGVYGLDYCRAEAMAELEAAAAEDRKVEPPPAWWRPFWAWATGQPAPGPA